MSVVVDHIAFDLVIHYPDGNIIETHTWVDAGKITLAARVHDIEMERYLEHKRTEDR